MAESLFLNPNRIEEDACRLQCYESCSSTHIKVIRFRHTWSISNFSFCCEKPGEHFESPTFSVGNNTDLSKWFFSLYPKGTQTISSGYVGLFLLLVDCPLSEMIVKCKLGIVNHKGKDKMITENFHRLNKHIDVWCHKFLSRDILFLENNEILLDDKLTVFCEITTTVGKENILDTLPSLETSYIDLSQDLGFLLENEEFSDVTLSTGGREFKAHKLILTTRSSVFKAMFQHDMQEAKNNRVEITDIGEEELSEMLRYMYTGRINKLKETAPRLLGVAEKYDITSLKRTCEKALIKSISVDNAVEFFILSDTYRSAELRYEVTNFITAHASDVMNTPGFPLMIRTHPDLAIELFRAKHQ